MLGAKLSYHQAKSHDDISKKNPRVIKLIGPQGDSEQGMVKINIRTELDL